MYNFILKKVQIQILSLNVCRIMNFGIARLLQRFGDNNVNTESINIKFYYFRLSCWSNDRTYSYIGPSKISANYRVHNFHRLENWEFLSMVHLADISLGTMAFNFGSRQTASDSLKHVMTASEPKLDNKCECHVTSEITI